MMKYSIEDLYDIIVPLGSGSYGEVFKARNRSTGEIVALKKIRSILQDEGFPRQALREICTLQSLEKQNKNIVSLLDVITSKKSVYLIFDYYEFDLHSLLTSSSVPKLTVPQVKCYMIQLMNALNIVHSHGIIHRDLKPANILLSSNNLLKLADFGLSRSFNSDNRPLTTRVMTQRYKPPELLLGSTHYGPEVDIWSLGCTFYEMMAGKPLFYGETETEQLTLTFKLLGCPSEKEWPSWRSLPNAHLFQYFKPFDSNFDEFLDLNLPSQYSEAKNLLKQMLSLNPSQRIKINQALSDSFFYSPNEEYSPLKMPPLSCEEAHSNSQYEYKSYQNSKTEKFNHKPIYQELRPIAKYPPPIFAD